MIKNFLILIHSPQRDDAAPPILLAESWHKRILRISLLKIPWILNLLKYNPMILGSHEPLKKGDGKWYCPLCGWHWKSKPRSSCPRVPRYEYGDQPSHLVTGWELERRNLKPTGAILGAIYLQKSHRWISLYDLNETAIDDPHLPPAYSWKTRPKRLLTIEELRDLNKAPDDGKELCSDGVIRLWDKEAGKGYWVHLYDPDKCRWQPKDNYIPKGALKKIYLMSEGWIKRLGEPDLIKKNPHHTYGAPMKLYSRQRVEFFLAENALDYAEWLDKRERFVIRIEVSRERMNRGREQQRQCLQCSSGCALPQGFFCAIHPMGVTSIPCPDWLLRE